jgi:hypothetical protein
MREVHHARHAENQRQARHYQKQRGSRSQAIDSLNQKGGSLQEGRTLYVLALMLMQMLMLMQTLMIQPMASIRKEDPSLVDAIFSHLHRWAAQFHHRYSDSRPSRLYRLHFWCEPRKRHPSSIGGLAV